VGLTHLRDFKHVARLREQLGTIFEFGAAASKDTAEKATALLELGLALNRRTVSNYATCGRQQRRSRNKNT
jgi:hypothetical protein